MDLAKVVETIKSIASMGLGTPVVIVMILSMIVLPLPPFIRFIFYL